ncbi:MAG: hypothetical protein Q9M43_04065 [Sulfurimonas sp.]|nr:hypothetical protein [Sulfurimonas sp.]
MFQSYVMQKEYVEYDSLAAWEEKNTQGLLIQNDENGGAVYFYFNENSEVGSWIKNKLQDFSLDEVLFQAK